MKFINALTLLAAAAVAAPAELMSRQSRSTRNDLVDGDAGDCPEAILIFARGTGEAGNMGGSVGPALSGALEDEFDNIWVQGVSYSASTAANLLPKGTSEAAIRENIRLYELANSKCPATPVITAGYSQGAALVAASLSELDPGVKDQVKGAALFGYTKNRQNNERIPNYPLDRTQIFCNIGDLVCTGSLVLAPPHFAYNGAARGEGADFLTGQVSSF